jgi:hypothetical protein
MCAIIETCLLTLARQAETERGGDRDLERRVSRALGGEASTDRCTHSLDAAESLRNALLPHSEMAITQDREEWFATIWGKDDREFDGDASSAPRALVAAVLRAYVAEGIG